MERQLKDGGSALVDSEPEAEESSEPSEPSEQSEAELSEQETVKSESEAASEHSVVSSDMSELDDSDSDDSGDFLSLDFDSINDKTSERAQNFLVGLFKELSLLLEADLQIKFHSRLSIEDSFKAAMKQSQLKSGFSYNNDLLSLYLKTTMITNYQYFSLMIKRTRKAEGLDDKEKKRGKRGKEEAKKTKDKGAKKDKEEKRP